jgi:hypothetical protein
MVCGHMHDKAACMDALQRSRDTTCSLIIAPIIILIISKVSKADDPWPWMETAAQIILPLLNIIDSIASCFLPLYFHYSFVKAEKLKKKVD